MCRTAAPSARQLVARSVAVTRSDDFIAPLAPNGAKVIRRGRRSVARRGRARRGEEDPRQQEPGDDDAPSTPGNRCGPRAYA